jgi:hypothetical protein
MYILSKILLIRRSGAQNALKEEGVIEKRFTEDETTKIKTILVPSRY